MDNLMIYLKRKGENKEKRQRENGNDVQYTRICNEQ